MHVHLVLHMYKKFQVNQTKIKGGCQSETKAAHYYSCTDLTLNVYANSTLIQVCNKSGLVFLLERQFPAVNCFVYIAAIALQ